MKHYFVINKINKIKIISLMVFVLMPFISLFSQKDTTLSQYKLLASKYIDASNQNILSDPKLALKFGLQALKYSLKSKNDLLLSQNYKLVAEIYKNNYENKNATDNYNKSIFHALANKDYKFAHQLIISLADVQRALGNYSLGLRYLSIADYYTNKIRNQITHAEIYNRKSAIYYEVRDYQKAIDFATVSLKIAQDSSKIDLVANNQVLIGASLGRLFRYNESIDVLLEAKKSYMQLSPKDLPYVLNNICQTYTLMGEYDKAIEAGLESYEIAVKDSIKPYAHLASNYLFQTFQKKNDLKNAYKFLTISYKWSELINADFERQKVIETENKLKENQVRNEIQNYMQIIQQNEKIAELKKWVIILLIILVIFSISSLIIYKQRSKSINNAYQKLIDLNKQTILQKEEIQLYAEQLNQANASKNKFFSIITHDIRAPFHSILGLTDILQQDYEELSNEEKKEMINMLNNSSNNIFRLLDNLLKWSQAQTGDIQFKPERIELKPIVEEIVGLMQQNALSKNITLSFHFTENMSVNADKNMIDTICRNLISNAIKFTEDKGNVDVILIRNGTKAKVVVKDNGIGISDDDLGNILSIDKKNISKGTAGESGSGLGLLLCKEFTEKNKGELLIESEMGKGSSFAFLLPLID
jgi:signal transduction histidine kinase